MVFLWFGAKEADSFNIGLSFRVLLMVIISGLGGLIGAMPEARGDLLIGIFLGATGGNHRSAAI